MVAVVCEPIDRIWSEFHHMQRFGQLPEDIKSIENLIISDGNLTLHDSIEKGFYVDHLKPWIETFGKERLFVANFKEMTSTDPKVRTAFLRQLLSFLELPIEEYDWNEREYDMIERYKNPSHNYTHEAPREVRNLFQPYFTEKNVQLAELLGEIYPSKWNDAKTDNV